MALIDSKTIMKMAKQPHIHFPRKNIPLKKVNAGRMLISESILLDWLQFPKGRIRNISLNDTIGLISIVLEDKEMPEVTEGESLQVINPTYIATYRKGKIVKVKREKLR